MARGPKVTTLQRMGARQRALFPRQVRLQFPEWPRLVQAIEQGLDVQAWESSAFVEQSVLVELPLVLLADWHELAQQLGPPWTLGRVASYFALQGAKHLSSVGEN